MVKKRFAWFVALLVGMALVSGGCSVFGGGYVEGNVGDRRGEPWWDHETPDAEDIQLARDLGRPDYVLDAMRNGEWGVKGDKTDGSLAYQPSYNKESVSTMRRAVHILEEAYGVSVTFDRIDNTPGNAMNLNARTYRAWGHITSGEYKDVFFEISWNVDTNVLKTSLPQILYKEKAYRYMEGKYDEILEQVSKETGIAKPSIYALYLLKEDTLQGQQDSVPYDQALPDTPPEDLAKTLGTGFNFVFFSDGSLTEKEYNEYVNRALRTMRNEGINEFVRFSVYEDKGTPGVEYFEPENDNNRQWLVKGKVSDLVKERGLS